MGNKGKGSSRDGRCQTQHPQRARETHQRRGPRERRHGGRVEASGTAIVRGSCALHGRIVDLAIAGLSLQVEGSVSLPGVGDGVHVVVRLDGAGNWFHVNGTVTRIEARKSTTTVAISLSGVPQDFEDLVQDELVSVLECAREPQILLVDAARGRRDLVAAAFRAIGCRVVDVSSPLEAIAEIDQSRLHLWAVVIADTDLASRADDLRGFLRETYPRVPLVVVGDGLRTRTHVTIDRVPDLALQIHGLVALRDQIGLSA